MKTTTHRGNNTKRSNNYRLSGYASGRIIAIQLLIIALLLTVATSQSDAQDDTSRDIAGTWYKMNYLDGKTDIITIKRRGSSIEAVTKDHSYVLQRTTTGYVGLVRASVKEVQRNVGIGTAPLSFGMASSAVAQKAMWFKLEIEYFL